jgi:hypothetical protein
VRAAHITRPSSTTPPTWNGKWDDLAMSPNSCFTRDRNVPTEPNAGFLKYAPGASFPLHRHDFAQIWYIIKGEFTFARRRLGDRAILSVGLQVGLRRAEITANLCSIHVN